MPSKSTVIERRDPRTFGPLVAECLARGIGRSTAFLLARTNQIETFHLGHRTFVKLASLDALADRLLKQERAA